MGRELQSEARVSIFLTKNENVFIFPVPRVFGATHKVVLAPLN